MTTAQLQGIADRTLRKIALKYGSTTRRDFRVIEIVFGEMAGGVSVPASGERGEQKDDDHGAGAPVRSPASSADAETEPLPHDAERGPVAEAAWHAKKNLQLLLERVSRRSIKTAPRDRPIVVWSDLGPSLAIWHEDKFGPRWSGWTRSEWTIDDAHPATHWTEIGSGNPPTQAERAVPTHRSESAKDNSQSDPERTP